MAAPSLLPRALSADGAPKISGNYVVSYSDASHTLTVRRAGRVVWSADTYLATQSPDGGPVVYEYEMAIVARRLSGDALWSHQLVGEGRPPYEMLASGDTVLALCPGPTWGVSSDWLDSHPQMEREENVYCYRLSTGKLIWKSNVDRIGMLVWWNGRTMVDLRADYSRKFVRRYLRHGTPIPVALEVRDVAGRRCRWRRWLTRLPDGLVKAPRIDPNRVRFYFTASEDVGFDYDFLGPAASLVITVPVSRVDGLPGELASQTTWAYE